MENITFQSIKTNGVNLNTAVAGPEDGPLLILLHGFPEFWYGWQHQIDPLAELGYRVLIPDQRGYNLSDKPEGIENYTLNELRDDIVGLIEQSGEKKAVIIGHDWGGAVAWHLAATKPEYVEQLMVINIPHPRAMPKVMMRNPLQMARSSYMAFFQLRNIPEKMMETEDFGVMKKALSLTSKKRTFSKDDLTRYEESWKQPGAMTAMLNWYRALRAGSVKQTPDTQLTVPVRIIWGMGDQFLSAMLAKESLAYCEDGNLVLVGEATHWVQHEQPNIVNYLISQFLEEKRPAAL